jgi:hypothetical protein
MHRYAVLAGMLSVVCLAALPSAPAFAVTAKDKMVTCRFGASYLKLSGNKRSEFIRKCMMNPGKSHGPATGSSGMKPAPKS